MADYSSSSSTDNNRKQNQQKQQQQQQQPQVLPKGWIRTFSNSQQRYYYSHKDTKHTQWHFPTASEAADPWMAQRRAQENQEKEKKRSTTSSSATASSASTTPASTSHPPPSSKRPRTEESASASASATTTTTTTTKPTSAAPPNSNSNTININPLDALLALADTTNVAIIVPYRDLHVEQQRAKHLQQFVPYMIQFMTRLVQQQKVSDFHIYIIEQSNDGRKFNRGKLLNIGFDLAKKNNNKRGNGTGKANGNGKANNNTKQHDVFIFHDVDLLPQPPLSDAYATFPKTPYHIARVWDRYSNNPKYFGGIVAFSASDFKRINGYPNTFWGWGGEDDELQLRCQALGLVWDWPRTTTTIKQQSQHQSQNQQNQQQQQLLIQDLEDMTLQDKLQFLRQHKEWKCMVKWEALEEHEQTWKINGLADLQYTVLHTEALDSYSGSSSSSSSSSKATKITVNVQLNPNHHWANDKCSVDYMGG